MKITRSFSFFILLVLLFSCGRDSKITRLQGARNQEIPANIPIDKGFSQYIASYTSGIVPANSTIEIRFTPEFAAKANKTANGLFVFEPSVKGKTEWKDDATLLFTPSHTLDAGKVYSGRLNLARLANVEERLETFPLRIQTVKKDFRVVLGALECPPAGGEYVLHGQVIASDYIQPSETEAI